DDSQFPFSEYTSLESFARQIDNDKELKTKVLEKFCSFGGRKPSLHVASILSELMTDELAKEYSWRGLRNNRNFSELGLLKLIYRTR
ncbi:unnamed protein product, partial [Allacma fusca]